MQQTNGNPTQRVIFLILAAGSLLLSLSYFQSEHLLRGAAHGALTAGWAILAFGGTKGHRPKWFKFAFAPVVVLIVTLAALAVWPSA
jgi:hypothetical protein